MKVFQVFNQQRTRGGDEAVVESTIRLLAQDGHSPRLLMKSSNMLESSLTRKVGAALGGIYNYGAYLQMKRLLEEERPDVVHVHSLYPMFSPSILVACRKTGVPVVMTVHSHGLTCPTWFHFYNGQICEDCVGGHEYQCILKNCRANIWESFAYALRHAVATRCRLFHDNISILVVLTQSAKARLLTAGFHEDQIVVVPNAVADAISPAKPSAGKYVAYAGRISPEKGLGTLLDAARAIPEISFKVAGDGPAMSETIAAAPSNMEFLGRLQLLELRKFYKGARCLIVPSVCLDQFPTVALEAMANGLPVIASRLGGYPRLLMKELLAVCLSLAIQRNWCAACASCGLLLTCAIRWGEPADIR